MARSTGTVARRGPPSSPFTLLLLKVGIEATIPCKTFLVDFCLFDGAGMEVREVVGLLDMLQSLDD